MKKYILAVFSAVLVITSFAQSWSLTGNSGTNPPTNFLGTKDSKALVFKTNNMERMRINPTGNGNVGIGVTNPVQRLDVNGNINIGKGFSLFMDNHRVLRADSSSGGNVFLGVGAGSNNTSYSNTATGFQAFFSNTSGNYNTANGYQALYHNYAGNENTATGALSLHLNTGYQNVANGTYALYSNRTGSYNTATGYQALYNNTTGSNNTSYGYQAFFNNVNGSQNVVIGDQALYYTTASWGNTAVGYSAGSNYDYGYNNTFIGSYANAGSDVYNSIALGSSSFASASNQARIGNSYTTSIGGYTNWSNISDGRVKKNIKENVPGLAFINKLKPITYNLDLDAADKIAGRSSITDKDGKLVAQRQMDMNARNAKQQVVYTGFVAQDVEKAAKELNYDFSGVDAAKSDKDLYALRYSDFVVPLVKAVQDLSKMNDEKEETINGLKFEIQNLKSKINELKSMITSGNPATTNYKLQTTNTTSTSLQQNIPNPFHNTTKINYMLPLQFTSAKIIITDKLGKTLKEINVSGSGKESLNIDGSSLSAGAYQYSLYVDRRLINTKQMVLIK